MKKIVNGLRGGEIYTVRYRPDGLVPDKKGRTSFDREDWRSSPYQKNYVLFYKTGVDYNPDNIFRDIDGYNYDLQSVYFGHLCEVSF